jgi:hypothetical protein
MHHALNQSGRAGQAIDEVATVDPGLTDGPQLLGL